MSEYQEFTGKTVEEALRDAREAFGVAGLDELDFEILTPGSRGVLGMGAEPARIIAAPRSALGGAAPRREAAPAATPLPPPREPRPPREGGYDGTTALIVATGRGRDRGGRDRGRDRGRGCGDQRASGGRRPSAPRDSAALRRSKHRFGDRGGGAVASDRLCAAAVTRLRYGQRFPRQRAGAGPRQSRASLRSSAKRSRPPRRAQRHSRRVARSSTSCSSTWASTPR